MPVVPINYLAVLICGIIAVVLGWIWFGPLFGKMWGQSMGWSESDMEAMRSKPNIGSMMIKNMLIAFVAALVMGFVLEHSLIFGAQYLQISGASAGLQAGFWSWLGFMVPVLLGAVLWESKSWKWLFITAGYYLVLLLIMGEVLALM